MEPRPDAVSCGYERLVAPFTTGRLVSSGNSRGAPLFVTAKWTLWTRRNCLMAARRLPTTRPVMMKTAGGLSVRWTMANSIWWSGQNGMGGRGLLPRIAPMTGKSEHIVHYTAEQLKAKRQRGEGQTDWHMSQDEAMQRRHADPEAPLPSPGWEDTMTVEIPEPKEQITLRLDKDVLAWFRTKGKGYQTLINAVLRSYYEHERLHTDRHELQ